MADGVGRLLVEERGAVLVLTLARGARRNAVDQPLADQLDAAFARLDAEPGLRAAVLTGEPPCFSAGTDLALATGPTTPDGGPYGFVRRRRSKPVVAAVEGYALGGGFEMVLACDLVVAADDAVFGLPEVKRGVVANCGAFFRAPDKLPPAVALEMLLTGDPLPATRLHELGAVNVLTPPGATLAAAVALADRIAVNSPAAVAETLRAVGAAREEQERSWWPLTEQAAERAARSPDRAEGIAAFFERRAPRWSDPAT